jgi:hypothetical protein
MAVLSWLLSNSQARVPHFDFKGSCLSTLVAAQNCCSLSILVDCLVALNVYPMLRELFQASINSCVLV